MQFGLEMNLVDDAEQVSPELWPQLEETKGSRRFAFARGFHAGKRVPDSAESRPLSSPYGAASSLRERRPSAERGKSDLSPTAGLEIYDQVVGTYVITELEAARRQREIV
jgi:hypothetical protein